MRPRLARIRLQWCRLRECSLRHRNRSRRTMSTVSVEARPVANDQQTVDVAIVGSGFSGLGMAIRLKQEGRDDFVVLERDEDVGGTWHANTYPGCACDVPSHLYSYSFAPNPEWSQTYSRQPEI